MARGVGMRDGPSPGGEGGAKQGELGGDRVGASIALACGGSVLTGGVCCAAPRRQGEPTEELSLPPLLLT